MDYILEHLEGWGLAFANLVLGVLYAREAITGVVKEKQCTGAAFLALAAGVVLAATGLLHFIGILEQQWLSVGFFAVTGLLSFLAGTGKIVSTVAVGGVRKGLAVVFGVVAILWAVLNALRILRFPPY